MGLTSMRLIHDHILRNVHEDVVLVPLSGEETDFRGMLVLNETGEYLCKMLRQDTDRDSLVAALAREYATQPEQVEADVDGFLSQLDACHLLVH